MNIIFLILIFSRSLQDHWIVPRQKAPPPLSSNAFESFSDPKKLIVTHQVSLSDSELAQVLRVYERLQKQSFGQLATYVSWMMVEEDHRGANIIFLENAVSLDAKMNGMVPRLLHDAIGIFEALTKFPFICPFALRQDTFVYLPFERKFVLGNLAGSTCSENETQPSDFFLRMIDQFCEMFGVFSHSELKDRFGKLKNFRQLAKKIGKKDFEDLKDLSLIDLARFLFSYDEKKDASEKAKFSRKIVSENPLLSQKGTKESENSNSKSLIHLVPSSDKNVIHIFAKDHYFQIIIPPFTATFLFICSDANSENVSECVDSKSLGVLENSEFHFDYFSSQINVNSIEYRAAVPSESHRSFIEVYLFQNRFIPSYTINFENILIDFSKDHYTFSESQLIYCRNSLKQPVLIRTRYGSIVSEEYINLFVNYDLPDSIENYRITFHPAVSESSLCTDRFKELYLVPLKPDQGLYFPVKLVINPLDQEAEAKTKLRVVTKGSDNQPLYTTNCFYFDGGIPPIKIDQSFLSASFNGRIVNFPKKVIFMKNKFLSSSLNTCILKKNLGQDSNEAAKDLLFGLTNTDEAFAEGCINYNAHELQKDPKFIFHTLIYETFNAPCFLIGKFASEIPSSPTLFFRISLEVKENKVVPDSFIAYVIFYDPGRHGLVHLVPEGLKFASMPQGVSFQVFSDNLHKALAFSDVQLFYMDEEEAVYGVSTEIINTSKPYIYKLEEKDFAAVAIDDSFMAKKIESYELQPLEDIDRAFGLKKAWEIFEERKRIEEEEELKGVFAKEGGNRII